MMVLAVFLFFYGSCGIHRIEPGWVGIKVNLSGGDRGVENLPTLVGWQFVEPFTQQLYQFPTHQRSGEWANEVEIDENDNVHVIGVADDAEGPAIRFNSMEGSPIEVDVAYSVAFEGEHIPALFKRFRQEADDLIGGYYRREVQEMFKRYGGQMPAIDILGQKAADLNDTVRDATREKLGPEGFITDQLAVIGRARVDKRVHEAISKVIEAQQQADQAEEQVRMLAAQARQKIEKAQGDAEAIRRVADAQADANRALQASLSPNVIEFRRLQIQEQAVEKWNGTMPQFVGQGGGVLLDLKGLGGGK